MASFTLLLLFAFPLLLLLLPPSPSGARTRLLSSRLDAPTMATFPLLPPPRLHALMMAFFPLLPSTPVSLPRIPSGARALPPRARVCLRRLLLHPFLVRHPRPLGCIPVPFLPSPLPRFLHLLLTRLLSSRLLLFLPLHSHLYLCFWRHFALFFFTFVKSHSFCAMSFHT